MFGSKKRRNRKFIDDWIVDILRPYERVSENESLVSQGGALLDCFIKFTNDPRSGEVVVKLEELDSPAYLVDNICKDAAERLPQSDIIAASRAFAHSNVIFKIGDYRPGSGVCEIVTELARRCSVDQKLKLLEVFDETDGLANSMRPARWDYQVYYFEYIFAEIESDKAVSRLKKSRSWNAATANPNFAPAVENRAPKLVAAL